MFATRSLQMRLSTFWQAGLRQNETRLSLSALVQSTRNGTRSESILKPVLATNDSYNSEGKKLYVQTFRTPNLIDCSHIRIICGRGSCNFGSCLKSLSAIAGCLYGNASGWDQRSGERHRRT